MGYYCCVYGSIDDILSVSAFESKTRDDADYKARNPPKQSNAVVGTEVLVIEISEPEYKKLNELFDIVESNPRLQYDFITGLKGVLSAVKDGTVIKGGILEGFKGIHEMLDVYSKYKLPDLFTQDMLAKALKEIKKDRANTHDKLKREFMDILIRNYSKKLELIKVNPTSTVIFT